MTLNEICLQGEGTSADCFGTTCLAMTVGWVKRSATHHYSHPTSYVVVNHQQVMVGFAMLHPPYMLYL